MLRTALDARLRLTRKKGSQEVGQSVTDGGAYHEEQDCQSLVDLLFFSQRILIRVVVHYNSHFLPKSFLKKGFMKGKHVFQIPSQNR